MHLRTRGGNNLAASDSGHINDGADSAIGDDHDSIMVAHVVLLFLLLIVVVMMVVLMMVVTVLPKVMALVVEVMVVKGCSIGGDGRAHRSDRGNDNGVGDDGA